MNNVCQTFFAEAETWNALSYGYKYTQVSLCVGDHSISSTFLLSLALHIKGAIVPVAVFHILLYLSPKSQDRNSWWHFYATIQIFIIPSSVFLLFSFLVPKDCWSILYIYGPLPDFPDGLFWYRRHTTTVAHGSCVNTAYNTDTTCFEPIELLSCYQYVDLFLQMATLWCWIKCM